MSRIQTSLADLQHLDLLAGGDSSIHRLEPRAKVFTTLVFIVAVISFERTAVSPLVPFMLYPLALARTAGIQPGLILKRSLLVLPFALAVGIWSPVLERNPALLVGGIAISEGWFSFASIIIRSLLTVSSALVLMATTGFVPVCRGLQRLGFPRVFTLQLLFLHRYLFVLGDEAARRARARDLRSSGGSGFNYSAFSSLIASLLFHTWERAERINRAMLSRGFRGTILLQGESTFSLAEYLFMGGWCTFFIITRFLQIPRFLGVLLTGGVP